MTSGNGVDQAAPTPARATAQARPMEIEEPLNRWFVHPMSRAIVAVLAPTPVTPNMVSVMGVVMMALACACYALMPWPVGPLAGLVFHIGWHVFDGADGELARRTGKSSPIGEIVDGVCDHVSHLILYLTLGAILARSLGGWAWPIALVSGLSRGLQAISYETARRNYRRWVYGVSWIRQDVDKAAKAGAGGRIGAFLAGLYLKLSVLVRADDSQIEEIMGRLASEPGKAAAARALYREEELRLVKRASWLSTNWETAGVFLSMLAGSPVWFLVLQAVGLNLFMAWCVASQARSYRRLLPRLQALA
jgi:phosphatidylglycerophosphate synthase